MPLALPEMAVFIASTICETTESSEPVHCDVVPSRACASSMPYWVGMKNGFVVTWLTKTKFHSGVSGKLPPDPPDPPWLACCAASRLQLASNSPVCSFPTSLLPPALSYQYMFVSSASRSLPGALSLVPPQAHPGRGTAVHVEDLSRNEVGSVGDEEGDRRGHILGMADAAPGDEVVSDVGGVVGDIEVTGDLYDTGTNRVDADLTVGELDGELAGEAVDRTLGGRVGRVVGEAREPVD